MTYTGFDSFFKNLFKGKEFDFTPRRMKLSPKEQEAAIWLIHRAAYINPETEAYQQNYAKEYALRTKAKEFMEVLWGKQKSD